MTDVIVIGAGPAGLAGAIACAENRLKVTVLDEFMKPGGRLLGQLHEERPGKWWNGIEEAKKLHKKAMEHGVDLRLSVSVFNMEYGENIWRVYTNAGTFEAPFVLIATGAAEFPIPVPGWTLPGVMSIGAAQVMTNVHRVRVGKKGVIIGANILAFAILNELQLAGVHVDRVVLPEKSALSKTAGVPEEVMKSLLRAAHLAPSRFLRFGSRLMKMDWFLKLGLRFYPKGGISINGTLLQLRKAAVEIVGKNQVEGVRTVDIDAHGNIISNSVKEYEADFVCIAGGLYPLVELAAVAGCPFEYIPELGGHVPVHSETMETPVKGLFVAGNITGIESGKIAMAQGTVAGLSIAKRTGKVSGAIEEKLQEALNYVKEIRESSSIQFHPEIETGRKRMAQICQRYFPEIIKEKRILSSRRG